MLQRSTAGATFWWAHLTGHGGEWLWNLVVEDGPICRCHFMYADGHAVLVFRSEPRPVRYSFPTNNFEPEQFPACPLKKKESHSPLVLISCCIAPYKFQVFVADHVRRTRQHWLNCCVGMLPVWHLLCWDERRARDLSRNHEGHISA
jgi:hypothetical protein